MPYNILNHAARVFHGGDFPLTRDLEDARRYRDAKRISEEKPYTKHLRDYIKDVCPDFEFTPFVNRLIDIGEAIIVGDLQWAMIELPPRHFKSTIFSRFMPGCYIRRNPNNTVGLGAYSQTLAEEFGRDARDYYLASGGVLDSSTQGVGRWKSFTGRGGMWVAGVGKGTGLPANLLGLDDPVKGREEADSAAYRRQLHNWLDTVMFTRLEPGARGWVTHTRWHEMDAIGHLLDKNKKLEREGLERLVQHRWHVISLPMLATGVVKELPLTVTREPEHREIGQALDPIRFNEDWAAAKQATMTDRDWNSIYQQNPTPEGGTVFHKDHFRYYVKPGEVALEGDIVMPQFFSRRLLSVDCSFKDTAGSDMVAMTLWGQDASGKWLLDVINQRLDFTDTLETIVNLSAQKLWNYREVLIEDAANGPAVISSMKRKATGILVSAVRPLGGKVPRANACAPQFKRGEVFFPRYHKMLHVVENQLIKFPADDYDDIVDSVSQALNHIEGTGPIRVSTVIPGRGA